MKKDYIDAIRSYQKDPSRDNENKIYNIFKPFVMKLVSSAMMRFSVEHSYAQDLQSIAYIELFRMLNRVDLSIDPSSIIYKYLNGALSKECSSMRAIKVPRSLNLFLWRLLKIKNAKEASGEVFELEIELLQYSESEKYKNFIRSFFENGFNKKGLLGNNYESFDNVVLEDGSGKTFHDIGRFGKEDTNAVDFASRNEIIRIINKKISSLTKRRRDIVESALFGRGGDIDTTELSKKYGITKQRCSQIILDFKGQVKQTIELSEK